MRCVFCTIAAATLAFGVISSMATAQQGSSTQQAISANPASNPDQELGRRFIIKAENLPPPKSDPVAASRSLLIPYAGQTPRVMEGFTATPFVTGLEHPRRLLVLPNNDVIVAEQRTGYLTLLRDQDGDGKADFIQRYADDFKAPYGLAYRDGFVLVADQEGIWRVPHVSGAVRGGRPDQPRITDVPPEQRKPVPAAYGQELITQRGVFGVIAGHQNRHLAIDPKTGALFVGVGSAGNIGVEPEVKASVQRFEADGSGQTTFASGIVALKGSWNRSEPTGYKVVRVRFKDGRPDGSYENFVTGFWVSGQHRAEVWGRPAALAVMKDGSLLIADDTGGTIWRVSYTGPKERASDQETTTGAPQR
jgi:glucose/arabinose dehydrogenase